ncbi:hypothetical protein SAY87_030836 [Trapa incisa]|uniref:Mitochondrial metalloendopeptidase OMA1 n=1 Tax=Trapa incisa TaxID=236973 RepID=A0AAN7KQ53_9MYRT|nr:hypothetical protein SAY87_030836 [Trapa incisa]
MIVHNCLPYKMRKGCSPIHIHIVSLSFPNDATSTYMNFGQSSLLHFDSITLQQVVLRTQAVAVSLCKGGVAYQWYDPQIASTVYERLGKVTGDSALKDYLSTHPSGKKRAELLAQAKVMEEAVAIHREVRTGRDMEGFL